MKKRILKILTAVFFAISFMTFTAWADVAISGSYNYASIEMNAVVSERSGSCELRFGPGLEYGIYFELESGTELMITRAAGNFFDEILWGQTEYDGFVGWVDISQLDITEIISGELERADLVSSSCSETISQEIDGELIVFDFQIPKINLQGDEIREFNDVIYNTYYKLYQEIQTELKTGRIKGHMELPDLSSTGVIFSWNEDAEPDDEIRLVIIVNPQGLSGLEPVYYVYRIAASDGTILEPENWKEPTGYTEEEYLKRYKNEIEGNVNVSAEDSEE